VKNVHVIGKCILYSFQSEFILFLEDLWKVYCFQIRLIVRTHIDQLTENYILFIFGAV
jgi:hypothetical protein